MTASRQSIRSGKGARLLVAGVCLLVSAAARADIQAVDGPCRLKLRSGRIMEAHGLRPIDATGAFWRIALDDQNSLVVPLRELKRVEPLPARAISSAAGGVPGADDASPDSDSSCDPATDPRIIRWDALILESSARHGIEAELVRSIVAVESCGDANAVSRKGAIGLMQLMPMTALDYGCANPQDPKANVEAGCRHIARLHAKLGGELDLVLAAYNAGEGVVARANGVPRYRETQAYVRSVLAHRARLTASDPAM